MVVRLLNIMLLILLHQWRYHQLVEYYFQLENTFVIKKDEMNKQLDCSLCWDELTVGLSAATAAVGKSYVVDVGSA